MWKGHKIEGKGFSSHPENKEQIHDLLCLQLRYGENHNPEIQFCQ